MQNPWKDIVPYTKEDAARFKGRDEDIRKFSRILQYSDFSVLYAESGIGKTSFINAGIIPLFAASNYKDIVIHFPTDIYNTPVEKFRDKFEQFLCKCIFEVTGLKEEAPNDCLNLEIQDDLRKSLWWRLHAYTYKTTLNAQEQTIRPFIIFDQFEEVFQKASPEILNELFHLLLDLSSKMPPSDLMAKLKTYNRDELYDQIDNDIHFKVLFALRKEYLAEFDHWTNTRNSIPEMLQNRMLLQSFTREQAEEVITKQELNDDAVHTLDLVKDNILSLFERRNAEGQSNVVKQNAGYEAFLLSVICSRLYDFAQAKAIAQVTPKEMEGFNISSLILNFYEASIRELSIPHRHLKVIEEELVDEYGDRNRIKVSTRNLASIQFEERYRMDMENKHIVRYSDGYIELIHDRVAEAIYNKRKEVNKRQWRWLLRCVMAVLIVLMSCVAVYSGWITKRPNNYRTSELRVWNELKLPEDDANYSNSRRFISKLTIDNDDATMSQKSIYNLLNLTDLKIIGRKANPTDICVDDCDKLLNLSLSDSLTSFPQVKNCPNLHFLRLPANVESFPESGFLHGMDSVEFAIPEKTPASRKYVWQDGILWSIADTCIIYAQTNADTILCFPEGIHAESLKYDGRTFSQPGNKKPDLFIMGRDLLSVKLYNNTTLDLTQPQYDTIETIGAAAFCNCKELQSVKLPSKLKKIGSYAFAGCTALSEITLPGSTLVKDYAFEGCRRLKRVYLSQDVEFSSLRYTWYTQFDDCDSVTFVLPETNAPGKFSKDENGILWYDDVPIFFNEVSLSCNYEDSLCYIRNGVVYRHGFVEDAKHTRITVPWSVSSKVDTRYSPDWYNNDCVIIINADRTEYVSPVSYIAFRNPRKLTELHLSNCNCLHLPQITLSDFAKSHITLYVPWGCRKFYEASGDYAEFKEIREDSWWRRLANLLAEMWQYTMNIASANQILDYILICIVLLVFGVIYHRRFNNLVCHNSDNRSRNVLRWQSAITAAGAVFFFVLAWVSVYWLVFFNVDWSWSRFIFAHVSGIAFAILAVQIVVFNKTDWTALKRNIRNIVARIRHMNWLDRRHTFADTEKLFLSYLARAIRCLKTNIKKIVLLGSVIIITIVILSAIGRLLDVSVIINYLDGTRAREIALYDKLSGCLKLLTPKQKEQLYNYYSQVIDTPYKVLLDRTIGARHVRDVNHAEFSPDGKYIVTASNDDTAIVWDAITGEPIHTLKKHRSAVNHAEFSPDGKYIVTASSYGTAIVWDAITGEPIHTLKKHLWRVNHAEFSPDGKYIVTASDDDTAIVWDAITGEPIHTLKKHLWRVNHAEFSPDGKYIVTVSSYGTAIVWDAITGEPIHTLKKHLSDVNHAEFSPDGKYIVTASDDDTAIVWDAITGELIHSLSDIMNSHILRCAPNDSCLVATDLYDRNKAVLLNWSCLVTDTLNHAAEISDILFYPKADRFVTIGGDKVLVWDKHGEKRDSLHHFRVTGVSFISDGKRVISSSDKEIRAWNQSGYLVDSLEKSGRPNMVYHLGAKRRIAVENADSLVIVCDLFKGDSLVLDSARYMNGVESVCISPNGKHIVTAIEPMSDNKEVTAVVWSSKGNFEQELKCPNLTTSKIRTYTTLRDISYSWNGRYILGEDDSYCYIWDADSGMLLWRIDNDIIDIETAKSIDANREVTFVTREKGIKRVRLFSLKEMIEMRRQQLCTGHN